MLRLIESFKKLIISSLDPIPGLNNSIRSSPILSASLLFLQHLHHWNMSKKEIVTCDLFYIPELTDKVNIRQDYAQWSRTNNVFNFDDYSNGIYFSSFPFIFDAKAKSLLLKADSDKQKDNAVTRLHIPNIVHAMMSHQFALGNSQEFTYVIDVDSSNLTLRVRRDFLVHDTLKKLSGRNDGELKLPLKIEFVNEEGDDAGGIRKEFFTLVLRQILDPKFGMFDYYEETGTIWFKEQTFESFEMYNLIGKLCGLAIYNSVIIDLPFPLVLYKKLLKEVPNLSDLYSVSPLIARSLESLLAYEGDDFEDTFGLSFEITRQLFGEVRNIELIPGGSKKPVTKLNVKEYVDAYINYMFNESTKESFSEFCKGFDKICNSKIIKLFQPRELMSMVVGNQDYDFEELKKNTKYEGDYFSRHPVIKRFWTIFDEFSLEDKKKFLLFLTGTDRIPIFGMRMLNISIVSTNGGDQYYPVAHTCFNLLDLPKYSSIEVLRQRLHMAIQHNQGFTIV